MMTGFLEVSLPILANTPAALNALLHDVKDDLLHSNEGPETWSPFDIVGHLILCEQVNFMSRIHFILSDVGPKVLSPLDLSASIERYGGRTIRQLLIDFTILRSQNLEQLLGLQLTAGDLDKHATHTEIGPVTVRNVVSTWVAHDLSHIAQITRVLAKQYRKEVGPFIKFLQMIQ